jgi:ribosome biogenesis GTPase / thiamine phosphate phosphatase
MEGLVYKSTGSWYSVKDEQGHLWNARIKGKLKIDDEISSTNPIAVGDTALFDIEDEAENTAVISGVADRHNYIVRVSPHNKNQKHIVAANLDLALVIVTITSPRTSQGFIDRFLVTAEAYHIPAAIVINKTDLLKEQHEDQLQHWCDMYRNAGYEVYTLTTLEPAGVATLQARLRDNVTLFSGHSGVGKSTIINQLIPDLRQKTNIVSGWSGKGQHTTTFAEMFDLPGGGQIIDTPGVKEFGLIDLEKELLSHYFPEMRKVLGDCRFNNCLHMNEPGCAVKEGVANGTISEDRYISYLGILEGIEKKW